MLRHLILLLFLIGLSLPSVAVPVQAETIATACHDAMPTDAPHHQPDADDGKTAAHVCIGCVASPAANLVTSPPPRAALAPHARPMSALSGADILPSIPPPRP